MFKKSVYLLPLLALAPDTATADSNIVYEMSHIGFGYKHASLDTAATEPYLNGKYSNEVDKTYGGLYVDLGLSMTETLFLEGNASFVTRFSSEIDAWQAGVGFNVPVSPFIALPLSCGIINYRADSDYSPSYSENALYCKGGARAQIAKHWLIDASYQHAFLNVAKDTYRLNNVFQFGSVFGFTVGMEYAQREKAETAVTVGLQFTL
ncbi:hypothetical protein [Vibrio sp. TBV020]|uniref:hypothetical protein n=1 Tax=Vibrio sp. TBV020 TaxID=3137398 RepID=UPI0038CD3E94